MTKPTAETGNDNTAIRSALQEFMPRLQVSPDWRVMLAGASATAATTAPRTPATTAATFFQQHKLKILAGVAVLGVLLLMKGR